MTPEQVGEQIRELLLALPEEDRVKAIHAMDLCFHCGSDNRGREMTCQCWNDE